ncbi:hypothetical protein ATCV1_z298R [Acanthocystis turfacea chlorella virus 1]|uniref:Uncharacterized protein z298R n=1 Tax=Chlorovirus heliozoae TaxID=322019 RepID=A7K8Q8_9PHYC|nr:hypothetical protein ATCV1_z298R [Acanthocystis turfacea chlorella virus 1]ABT16432.1 hypothetical protein ATCV1_z298R [Acanthocystis turfacea chlorella virus 1]
MSRRSNPAHRSVTIFTSFWWRMSRTGADRSSFTNTLTALQPAERCALSAVSGMSKWSGAHTFSSGARNFFT